MSGVPPPPPGFTLDAAPPQGSFERQSTRAPPRNIPPPPGGFTLDGDAHDGDTFGLQGDGSLRLYGADAPELKQQGWRRDMTPVAIGQQAKAIADGLVDPTGEIGTLHGYSYGRPVAPVTDNGHDVGQSLIRSGNAQATPDYLRGDPRFAPYMEAERLARQNRLGVHGVYAQTPSDFRHSPDITPERETVARFWDTPTPFAGLRPEIEHGYLAINRTGSADDILKYASDNGFTVDPAKVRHFVASRDSKRPVKFELSYDKLPTPLTNQGDGASGAFARGIGDGVLPNLLPEVGSMVDTLGATDNRENVWNSDRRFADIIANNWRQNEAITGYDGLAHPYARFGGELTGGLALPFGAGAKTVPELARVGAAYGGAAGFGAGDGLSDRLARGVVGAGEGAVGGAVIGKGVQWAAPKLAAGWRWARGKGGEPVPVPESPVSAPDGAGGLPEGVPPPPAGFVPDAMPMAADAGAVATREVRQPDYLDLGQRPRPLLRDPTDTELRAATAGIRPADVLPINSNEVGSVEEAAAKDAGRFVEAKAPDERTALTRRTIRGWNGSEVPKLGPIDLIGFLRLRGGLKDNAGELRSMDFDNRPRKMDFAGQEHRFGPLLNNESGTKLDDAAFNAWEAGYFPDLSERPDTATFLEALRDNHHGQRRNFLPEDLPEVEAHNALRAERHDLEQRSFEEGAPIYTDRSLPADEPAPFPPLSAHEDWPDGGPDFAGNINLGKLDSPQDIKRALSAVNNRVGFDAATRGKVTHEETNRLAAELGMTPDTLLARRKGQAFNAEEALAARQILAKSGNELVNLARKVKGQDHPGDDVLADFNRALQRHVAIQEQVSGATAEAGRALSQFRMIASSRNVRGDVLSAIVSQGGGRRKLTDAADLLLEAAETSPGQFNVVAGKATKPGWLDKLVELRINMILSNPPTHIVNMVSNTMTALGQLPEHAVAAGVGAVRQAFTPKGSNAAIDRVAGSEIGARAFGLLQGVNEGLAQFAKTLRTGEPSDFISKVEGHMEHAIGGKVGSVIRTPTALLSAEDEIFKAMARRMELAGLAARTAAKEGLKGEAAKVRRAELLANPTPEMMDRAFDHGRYLTFQRPLGGIASKVSMVTRDYPALKFIVPFVRTPTNLLKFAVERSPAAPVLNEWRADWKVGGARRDLAISRVMVGTGFGMAMASLAARGIITGSPPSDKNKERLLRADGWQPYSFKIGDKYYSYQRLDPFATTISVAADLATKQEGMSPRQLDQQAMLLTASIMKTMGDKTWLSGVSDFLEAMSDPERYGPSYLRRLGASLVVPGGVGGVARAIDPVSRRADTVGEQVMASVPGQSSKLFPRRDVWGRPITNEGGVGPDYLSPMRQSTRESDPATNEMLRLNATMGALPKFHTVGGKRVEYSLAEYDRYSEAAGKGSHDAVAALIGSPGWQAMSPDGQRKAIKTAIDKARDAARGLIAVGTPVRGMSPGSIPPPPPGFAVEGEAGGVNVYQDIQRAIPGLRFTSGFRTREYQADMRRRGYHPDPNSAHLDGSKLDLLPPAGKSMDWLKREVRRFRPDAVLNNEGDHLDVRFPGYYGAPALGGAKAAGLRNPLAGMPPPPPGFRLDAQ